jgi:hypothetical protein
MSHPTETFFVIIHSAVAALSTRVRRSIDGARAQEKHHTENAQSPHLRAGARLECTGLDDSRPTGATLVSQSGFAAAMVRLSGTDHLASDEAYGRIGVRLRCSGNGLRSSDIAVQKSTKRHDCLVADFGVSVRRQQSNEIGDDVGDTDLLMTTSFAGNTV